jgi:hypothetical protein
VVDGKRCKNAPLRKLYLYELVPKLIDCALNAHGFGTSSWKNWQRPGFSTKIKVAVPKTEVLEQPHI